MMLSFLNLPLVFNLPSISNQTRISAFGWTTLAHTTAVRLAKLVFWLDDTTCKIKDLAEKILLASSCHPLRHHPWYSTDLAYHWQAATPIERVAFSTQGAISIKLHPTHPFQILIYFSAEKQQRVMGICFLGIHPLSHVPPKEGSRTIPYLLLEFHNSISPFLHSVYLPPWRRALFNLLC